MDAMYHEALASEEQVGQWGARGEDGHQVIGEIFADAIGISLERIVVVAPCERGGAIYFLHGIMQSGQECLGPCYEFLCLGRLESFVVVTAMAKGSVVPL